MSRYEEDYRGGDRDRDYGGRRDYRDDPRDRYPPPGPPRSAPPQRTTLYVTGFSDRHRAAELARIFEKVGPIVRCDIPATRIPHARQIAFVEYVKAEDAEYAYNKLEGTSIDGYQLRIEFARQQPSARWRRDGPPPPPPAAGGPPRGGRDYYSDRDPVAPPPPRGGGARSPPPRRPRSPSPPGGGRGGRADEYEPPRRDASTRDDDYAARDRDRAPPRDDDRRRSLSPERR